MGKRFEKRGPIMVYDKVSCTSVEVSSLKEASELTGLSEYTIRCSLNNPDHFTHKPLPTMKAGVYKYKGKYSKYTFMYKHTDPVVELWCCSEGGIPCQKFYSHNKAIQYLGISRSTYYRRMEQVEIGEPHPLPISGVDGLEWVIIFHAPKQEAIIK